MYFRKKPVVIEAVQFTGTIQSLNEVTQLMVVAETINNQIVIKTLEGEMRASVGDWIIKGVNGEFYPCKPDIFLKTYEPAPTEAWENHGNINEIKE